MQDFRCPRRSKTQTANPACNYPATSTRSSNSERQHCHRKRGRREIKHHHQTKLPFGATDEAPARTVGEVRQCSHPNGQCLPYHQVRVPMLLPDCKNIARYGQGSCYRHSPVWERGALSWRSTNTQAMESNLVSFLHNDWQEQCGVGSYWYRTPFLYLPTLWLP